MKTIELTRGQVALVDDEDFEELNRYQWYAQNKGNRFYARGTTKRPNSISISMHRSIMDTPEGLQTDHINGDGLDNRKSNLRVVTCRQNLQNRHTTQSSIYQGVNWDKRYKKWNSSISINGERKYLGHFDVEADAYAAYLKALEDIGEICVNDIKECF